MKKFLCLLMTLLMMFTLLSFTACQSEKEETLVVAMELAYPPFETKDENGDPTGVSVDLAYAIGEYLGMEVEIVNTAWDGLITSLQTDVADMVISSMTITEAREEEIDFSDPYAKALLAILVNNESGVTSIEDLDQEGMVIAVKTGSTGYFYAQNYIENAEIVALSDESACVQEVVQGKADAFFYDQLTIYRNQIANPDTTSALYIPFQDTEYWGIAVQEGNEELVSKINEFLADYDFSEITEKYLSEEKEAFDELGFEWFFD